MRVHEIKGCSPTWELKGEGESVETEIDGSRVVARFHMETPLAEFTQSRIFLSRVNRDEQDVEAPSQEVIGALTQAARAQLNEASRQQ